MVRMTTVSPGNAVLKRDLAWFDGGLQSWGGDRWRTSQKLCF
jgi:hypothetical protein